MKQLFLYLVTLLISCSGFTQPGFPQMFWIPQIECENRQNPMGVDVLQPRLSWQLFSSQRDVLQTAYRVLVSDDSSLLRKNIGNMWDSKKVISDSSIQVAYKGKPLQSAKKYFWKVMVWDNKGNVSEWSLYDWWQMGLLKKSDWIGAKWIGYEEINDTAIIAPHVHLNGKRVWGARRNVLPLLRKDFFVKKPVRNAVVFICGLGHFDLKVNGWQTHSLLQPGWTNYKKQALYVSYDITRFLNTGNNAIGVMLGNGFYYIPGQRYRKMTGAYGLPKMIARIKIEYKDGTTENVISDERWKTSVSPVIFSSIFGGEDYDATLEQKGWDQPGFDDSKWKPVIITSGPPQLDAQAIAPVAVHQGFLPVKTTELKKGVYVYDLAQNFSGIPFIAVKGQRGDTVKIIPSELLNDDGSANQRGSGGPCFFTYILKGGELEGWNPQFTYYGFRYLQVEIKQKDSTRPLPEIVSVKGLHVRLNVYEGGRFNCSSELFNKTYNLINWAIKSNMMSVLTDCPHREKLGWLEQTHLMGSSVQYIYQITNLCRKMINDMMLSQTEEGLVPEIAPEFVKFDEPFRDSPEWGSAAIILPWYNYQWYGDKQTLVEAYDMMQHYIAYLQKKSVNNILSQGLGDWYDIGPNRPGVSQLTPPGVTATAIYYYDLTIMVNIAKLLGKKDDMKQYQELAASVKKSFNEKFFDSKTNQYATGSQTANAMAVFMNLTEPGNREAVIANLIKDIRDRNNALTAGDIGYRYVLRVLEDAGRSDVIFDMNSRDDVPGYGYQLKNGATALTESWQAYPSVSNNHFMLGHLMEWFYSGLCGIKQSADGVAFKKIEIRPQLVGDVTHAEASFYSPYGLISSEWRKIYGNFYFNINIPANTTATIYIPGIAKPFEVGSGLHGYKIGMK